MKVIEKSELTRVVELDTLLHLLNDRQKQHSELQSAAEAAIAERMEFLQEKWKQVWGVECVVLLCLRVQQGVKKAERVMQELCKSITLVPEWAKAIARSLLSYARENNSCYAVLSFKTP